MLAASTDTTGVIKTIDAKAMTVALEDGTTYHLPAGYDLKTFKVGEKVVVSWEMKGTLKEATALKAGWIASARQGTGPPAPVFVCGTKSLSKDLTSFLLKKLGSWSRSCA